MAKFEKLLLLFFSIIGYFFLAFLFIGVVGSFLQNNQLPLVSSLNKFSFLIISWFYIKFLHKKINQVKWREYFSLRYSDIVKFNIGIILPIALTILSLFILAIINSNFEYNVLMNKASFRLLINSFVTSYNEELFFRCFVFFSLLKIIRNLFFSAFISSVFFALLHFGNTIEGIELISITNILVGGLLLCYMYYLTNSIWISIGFHTINNTIANVIESSNYTYKNADAFYLLTYTVLVSILLIICILIANQKAVPKNSTPQLHED